MGFLISLGLAAIGLYVLFVGFAVATSVAVHVVGWMFSIRAVKFIFTFLWVSVKAAFLLCFAFTPMGLLVILSHLKDGSIERFLFGAFPEFHKTQEAR
jgi:hypothetical protein